MTDERLMRSNKGEQRDADNKNNKTEGKIGFCAHFSLCAGVWSCEPACFTRRASGVRARSRWRPDKNKCWKTLLLLVINYLHLTFLVFNHLFVWFPSYLAFPAVFFTSLIFSCLCCSYFPKFEYFSNTFLLFPETLLPTSSSLCHSLLKQIW